MFFQKWFLSLWQQTKKPIRHENKPAGQPWTRVCAAQTRGVKLFKNYVQPTKMTIIMKKIIKFISAGVLMSALFAACQEDIGEETKADFTITTADGWLKSPQWLLDELERMADLRPLYPSGERIYPWVYSVFYGGQDYIMLYDMFSSNLERGHRYYTCSGEYIETEPDSRPDSLFARLEEARLKTGVLLWEQPLKSESGSTRAWISTTPIYSYGQFGTIGMDTN